MMEVEGKVTLATERDDHTKVVVLLGGLKKPYDDYLFNRVLAELLTRF